MLTTMRCLAKMNENDVNMSADSNKVLRGSDVTMSADCNKVFSRCAVRAEC